MVRSRSTRGGGAGCSRRRLGRLAWLTALPLLLAILLGIFAGVGTFTFGYGQVPSI